MNRNIVLLLLLCGSPLLKAAGSRDLSNFRTALLQGNQAEMVRLYKVMTADTKNPGWAQHAKQMASSQNVDIDAVVAASTTTRRRRPAATAATPAITTPATTTTLTSGVSSGGTGSGASTATTPPASTSGTASSGTTSGGGIPTPPPVPAKPIIISADAGTSGDASTSLPVAPPLPTTPPKKMVKPLAPGKIAEKVNGIIEDMEEIDRQLGSGGIRGFGEAGRVKEIDGRIEHVENELNSIASTDMSPAQRSNFQAELDKLKSRFETRKATGKPVKATAATATADTSGTSVNVPEAPPLSKEDAAKYGTTGAGLSAEDIRLQGNRLSSGSRRDANISNVTQGITDAVNDIEGELTKRGMTSTENNAQSLIQTKLTRLQNQLKSIQTAQLPSKRQILEQLDNLQTALNFRKTKNAALTAEELAKFKNGTATPASMGAQSAGNEEAVPQAPAMSALTPAEIQDRIERASKYFNGGIRSYMINFNAVQKNYEEAQNAFDQIRGSLIDKNLANKLDKQLADLKAKIDAKKGGSSTTPPPVPAKPISTSSDTYDSLTRELRDAPVVIPTELKTRAEAFLNANRSALTPEQVKRFEGHLGE